MKECCREEGVVVARDASIEHDSALGAGTHIDGGAQVLPPLLSPTPQMVCKNQGILRAEAGLYRG